MDFPAVLGFHSYDGNVDDMNTTLDRLDAEPSDVICPGLLGGTIHAFARDEAGRHADAARHADALAHNGTNSLAQMLENVRADTAQS